jgi:hypothetical protein
MLFRQPLCAAEDRWDEMKQGDDLLPRLKGKATFRRDVLPAKEHIQQAAHRADCMKKYTFESLHPTHPPPTMGKGARVKAHDHG